jgi:hypothetical protein
MFKPASNPTADQIWSLERVATDGIAAVAAMLRESYPPKLRAVYVEQLINNSESADAPLAVRAEVKRLLHKKGANDAIQNKQ